MTAPVQHAYDPDLMGIFQLIRARAQVLATDPTGLGAGNEGQFWYNSTAKTWKIWNGTAAIDLRALATMTGSLPVSQVTGAAATGTTRLSDFTTAPNAPVAMGGQKVTGAADGTASTDLVTKQQLDAIAALAASAAQGITIKAAVRAVDTVGITQTGAQAVDSVALVVGDRYLRAVGSSALNGIWVVQSGAHTRPTDADAAAELGPGTQVIVTEGALAAASGGNADSVWRVVSDAAITPGTTAHTWERMPGGTGEVGIAGAGLTKSGSTYDVVGGDGITVGADLVSVNPLRVHRHRQGTVPVATGTVTCSDGTTMAVSVTGGTVAFTHNLGNPLADVGLRYGSSPGSGNTQGGRIIPASVTSADGNTTTISLPAAPGSNQYLFDIVG